MGFSRRTTLLSAATLGLLAILVPATAMTQDTGEKAIGTRQGFMKLIVWEAGPLFGMAKGDVPYDAEAAKMHAANLKILTSYPFPSLFPSGTSNADYPGKTAALPKIWEDMGGFEKAFEGLQLAAAGMADAAGNGQEALAGAVGGLGKACGGCHNPYREKKQ